jgi:hypothetical protein
MCCFTGPVKDVSATKIFAREGDGLSQFIVYEMRVNAEQSVAMVLPLPIDQAKGEKALRFIDLSGYARFFDDLNLGFVQPRARKARVNQYGGAEAMDTIEVQRIGAFDASYVPTIADFKRLDERFRLPEQVWDKLPNYKDWGFAVFKLREGELNYHPMAFSFYRKRGGAVFFPTVHIHDAQVHANADFDHMLYCQAGYEGLSLTGWSESDGPASRHVKIDKTQGIVDAVRHCYRMPIKGRRPNRDIYVMRT